ncbi:MAG TPA: YajQ family cyclic di-GMP-binding protein [Verrucomicrobiae bacterium]|nr:YajQ family cyclic di-GMP-binding protein [Verrucomicrobiae bacterium]
MASESSFDIISKIDLFEVDNAISQASKEIANRFDFKGTGAEIRREAQVIHLSAADTYKLKALDEVLRERMAKRSVPLKGMTYGKPETTPTGKATQKIDIQNGIPTEKAKEIVKLVKDLRLKVQASILSDQVRVKGPKKDDLQAVMHALREADLGCHIEFTNFR